MSSLPYNPPDLSRDPALSLAREEIKREKQQEIDETGKLASPRRGRATNAGKGVKGRMTPDGVFVATEDIIEQCREMLGDSWPVGDIKRALVKKFGGRATSFNKHIALARKRNLAQLNRSPQESKSDSMQHWVTSLKEARYDKKRAMLNLQNATRDLERFRAESAANPPNPYDSDAVDAAAKMLELKLEAVGTAEKSVATARYWLDKYQTVIDSMLGNRAPQRIESSNTNSNTNTVDATVKGELTINGLPASTEPLTAKEGDQELLDLLQKVKGDLKNKVIKEATKGSEN